MAEAYLSGQSGQNKREGVKIWEDISVPLIPETTSSYSLIYSHTFDNEIGVIFFSGGYTKSRNVSENPAFYIDFINGFVARSRSTSGVHSQDDVDVEIIDVNSKIYYLTFYNNYTIKFYLEKIGNILNIYNTYSGGTGTIQATHKFTVGLIN